MTDREGNVLTIPDLQSPSDKRGRAEAEDRTSPGNEAAALLRELRVHNADLERQNAELRRQHIVLADSRDRYWDLFTHAPVAYLTLDEDGRLLDANLSATVLLGGARSRLIGRSLAAWLSGLDLEALRHHRRATLSGAPCATCRVQVRREDGCVVRLGIHSVALPDEHGTPRWHMVLVEDAADAPGTALLVEDDDSARDALRAILERDGLRVLAFDRPSVALRAFHQQTIDLVITDLDLPEMRGDELVARLRDARPELPIVIVSGASRAPPGLERDFLPKPVDIDRLRERVAEALAARAGGPPSSSRSI